MIQIGDFIFPEKGTVIRNSLIEAKSKIRREIRLLTLLRGLDPVDFRQQLNLFQESVEAFDRREANLLLHPGRYHQGRRRELHVLPVKGKPLAWIDLLILTQDRFERSIDLHEHDFASTASQAMITPSHEGNWRSPFHLTLTPSEAITSLQVQTAEETFTANVRMEEGQSLVMDTGERTFTVDGVNNYNHIQKEFPFIQPGVYPVILQVEPVGVEFTGNLQFQAYWV